MPSMVEVRSDNIFAVQDIVLGTRRPSVFGASIYYEHLGFSCDSVETDI